MVFAVHQKAKALYSAAVRHKLTFFLNNIECGKQKTNERVFVVGSDPAMSRVKWHSRPFSPTHSQGVGQKGSSKCVFHVHTLGALIVGV